MLLPVLLNITTQPIPEAAPPEILEELTKTNKQIELLTNIFSEIYATLQSNINQHHSAFANIRNDIKEIYKLFNFEKSALDNFSKNLAKAHHTVATNFYKGEIIYADNPGNLYRIKF